MKFGAIGIRRFLQAASGLIILGLLVEIVTLLWFHPLSFVLFAFVGAILIGLGIVVYLFSLVFAVASPAGQKRMLSNFASRDAEKEADEERIESTAKGKIIVPSYQKTVREL